MTGIFRKSVTNEKIAELTGKVNAAFVNRAGTAVNISRDPYILIYCGDEDKRGCLELGTLDLENDTEVMNPVSSWCRIDTDDLSECEDIAALAKKYKKYDDVRKKYET